MTLDHSPPVDFDIQLFDAGTEQLIRDCGVAVVPEVCAVSFVVGARDIAVDVVVDSHIGAGTYTLTTPAPPARAAARSNWRPRLPTGPSRDGSIPMGWCRSRKSCR